MRPAELVIAARAWRGVPFKHQGRSREYGVDCAGFLELLLDACGCLPRGYSAPRAYGRRPDGELRAVVERYCRPCPRGLDHGTPGTLLLICWPKEVEPGHVALCSGRTLIHSYGRVGRVVESGYRGIWVRDTHSAWFLPGVDYV